MKNLPRIITALPTTDNEAVDHVLERLREKINRAVCRGIYRRQYHLDVSGTNVAVNRAEGFVDETLDRAGERHYWLTFNISITLSAAAASLTATIDGVTFKENTAISYSDGNSDDDLQQGYAIKDTGNVYGESTDTSTTKLFSGVVELKQKPAWMV